jgi:hypothetical protein
MRKYKRGKAIKSIAAFDKSDKDFFIVYFGSTNPKTRHKAFLASWQYRVLKWHIERGWIYEAELINREEAE